MKYSWTTARGAKIDLDIDVKVITEKPSGMMATRLRSLATSGSTPSIPARERS